MDDATTKALAAMSQRIQRIENMANNLLQRVNGLREDVNRERLPRKRKPGENMPTRGNESYKSAK